MPLPLMCRCFPGAPAVAPRPSHQHFITLIPHAAFTAAALISVPTLWLSLAAASAPKLGLTLQLPDTLPRCWRSAPAPRIHCPSAFKCVQLHRGYSLKQTSFSPHVVSDVRVCLRAAVELQRTHCCVHSNCAAANSRRGSSSARLVSLFPPSLILSLLVPIITAPF